MSQPNQDERTQTRQHQGSITSAVLPKSTPLPNFFLDIVMPLIPATAWKVLCFVWRKTVGWNKWRDHISLSQISKGCGVGRDAAIKALGCDGALAGLVRKVGRTGIRGTIAYEPILDYDKAEVTSWLERLVGKNDQSENQGSTSRKNPSPPVEKTDTQKVTIRKSPKQKTNPGEPLGFDAFWTAYPRKVAKQAALKAWRKLNPDAELQAVIIRAVDAQKKTNKDWLKESGQYIPHAVTWLNGRRWEDEMKPSSTTRGGSNAGGHYAEVPSY
jgi:hypothetical protein